MLAELAVVDCSVEEQILRVHLKVVYLIRNQVSSLQQDHQLQHSKHRFLAVWQRLKHLLQASLHFSVTQVALAESLEEVFSEVNNNRSLNNNNHYSEVKLKIQEEDYLTKVRMQEPPRPAEVFLAAAKPTLRQPAVVCLADRTKGNNNRVYLVEISQPREDYLEVNLTLKEEEVFSVVNHKIKFNNKIQACLVNQHKETGYLQIP